MTIRDENSEQGNERKDKKHFCKMSKLKQMNSQTYSDLV